MADVQIDPENKNAKELLSQGIRAYVLQDYSSAVQALGRASELLVSEHGDDIHDSLGDVYFYYGKALLALSRQESQPLGDAIPKSGDGEESEEDVEEDEEAENDANEEKDKSEETDVKNGDSTPTENGQNGEGSSKSEEKKEEDSEKCEENGESEATTAKADENEEPTDLQVAWEVLELAKKIFEKRGKDGKKQLAETLTSLGEISLESENFEAAIVDIKDGLAIQEELFSKDNRKVAETCYNLGIAFSTNSQLDEAIDAFKKSLEYLNNRIAVLEEKGEDGKDEMNEIKELIPELLEKIADMKSCKEETIKKLAELTNEPELASKIVDGASSSSKQATDISHLVKRKRKPEENEEGNPPKKLSQ